MNRLANETSPYLLQHAENPVDWYPWGEEALERARTEDKPIMISIGYAACHWCHVMERESFEDAETAALMNRHFVSIKVDREERPDLDAIYMDAVQTMTGGGWPLTAFLTPQGRPFYAGTYYPSEARHGLPAFRPSCRPSRTCGPTAARRPRSRARGSPRPSSGRRASGLPAAAHRRDPRDGVRRAPACFDARWGGFGGAPKFPQPMTLEFCLRMHLRGTPDALEMVTTTLDKMAGGGMYDQVGSGFHRYSTDERWHVPHFEKMLYDNALLIRLYVHAWQVTGFERYRRVATETCEYLLRELRHAEGAFFSSQDADSEGVEGKFFVWTWDELVAVAGESVATTLGATPGGNWDGTNVLWRPVPLQAVAAETELDATELDPAELADELETARAELFEIREGRTHPATDDKILTAWNGLAIAALAEAGRAFGEVDYVDAAVRAADFVLTHLRDDTGRLLRSWRNGKAGGPAFADDHAAMADACLVLYETTFELRWFERARALADELVRLFHDEVRGGFFLVGRDAETLVVRQKELSDNATPSGNSAPADVLQRLAHLTGEASYEEAGVGALRLVRDAMAGAPSGFGMRSGPSTRTCQPSRRWRSSATQGRRRPWTWSPRSPRNRFLPNHVLAVSSPGDEASSAAVALLRDRPQRDGQATAYVCERFECLLPVTDPAALAAQVGATAIEG